MSDTPEADAETMRDEWETLYLLHNKYGTRQTK